MRIIKNYIYNLVYQIIVLLVPLVTAPYLARVLGPEGTGTYSYVNSMSVLICTIVMLGIYNYGNRQIAYVRDDKKKLNEVFWQVMSERLVIAIIGTIVYWAVVLIIGRYQFYFLLYYTFIFGYFIDCTWLFVGVEDMKWAVIKNILAKLIAVAGIFCLVRSENDVGLYILIQGLAVLVGNVFSYTQLGKYVQKPRIDFSNLKEDILGSAKLFLPSVAATLYLQCDKIMIELMTGATNEVSLYDYSEKIVTIPLTFITVLSTVMMPRIANEFKKGQEERIGELINNTAKMSLFMAFPLTLGLVSVADKLVPWYLGNDFLETITAITIISPIILTNTLSGISGTQYFTATDQIGILLKAQISAAVGNLIINAILIPIWGFVGAAVATVISSMLCAVIQYIYLLKQVKLPGLLKVGLKYFVISIVMFAVIRLVTMGMAASALTNVIQMVIGALVYFGICLLSKDKQMHYVLASIKKIFSREKA